MHNVIEMEYNPEYHYILMNQIDVGRKILDDITINLVELQEQCNTKENRRKYNRLVKKVERIYQLVRDKELELEGMLRN